MWIVVDHQCQFSCPWSLVMVRAAFSMSELDMANGVPQYDYQNFCASNRTEHISFVIANIQQRDLLLGFRQVSLGS